MEELISNKRGYRVSLKDILSKKSAETLESIAKAVKSETKARDLPKRDKPDKPKRLGDLEVEVKNDKGNPLPVVLPNDTFKFSEKLSAKIDNVGSLIGQPAVLDETKLFAELGSLKDNLALIQSALLANKNVIEEAGKKAESEELAFTIEKAIHRVVNAIRTGDKEFAKLAAEESIKASEDSKGFIEGVSGLRISVTDAIEAGNKVIESSYSSLQSQKLAAESIFSILKEEGYKNEKLLENLALAVTSGTDKTIKLAMESIIQDKENYLALTTDSKRSQKALSTIADLNTEMATQLHEQTVQEMLAQKYKKTAAFGKSDLGKGLGSMISSLLGIPGLELLISPIMDVVNLLPGLSTAASIGKKALGLAGDAGKGILKGVGKLGKMGGAVTGGILSAGLTGYDEYSKYQDAKDKGASEEELGKMKTKGISKTVGSGIGAAGGAAIGSLLGPLGTIAGGYLGSLAGEWVGDHVGEFLNDDGVKKLKDSVVNFFKDVGGWAKEKFSEAISSIKSMGKYIADKFNSIKDNITELFGEGTVLGAMKDFLSFALNPIGYMIDNFDAITEGIEELFGEKGVFGIAQKYLAKILDSSPIKFLKNIMTSFTIPKSGGNYASPTTVEPDREPNAFESQVSTPEIEQRQMDTRSATMDRMELESQRKARKEPATQVIQSSSNNNTSPPRQNNDTMNNKPVIDDYGLAFMNSAMFE